MMFASAWQNFNLFSVCGFDINMFFQGQPHYPSPCGQLIFPWAIPTCFSEVADHHNFSNYLSSTHIISQCMSFSLWLPRGRYSLSVLTAWHTVWNGQVRPVRWPLNLYAQSVYRLCSLNEMQPPQSTFAAKPHELGACSSCPLPSSSQFDCHPFEPDTSSWSYPEYSLSLNLSPPELSLNTEQ